MHGEVVATAPIADRHQDLAGFLISILRPFLYKNGLGRILYEPIQMKTGPELTGRAPDLLFIAAANLKRLKRTHLEGPADLVIEIISPESRGRDRS